MNRSALALPPRAAVVLAALLLPCLGPSILGGAEAELPRPSEAQARWQDLEFGIFVHFGINTFHGVEWSDGTLDPRTFNPRELDAGQWADTARRAGARYLVLTAKHHDGFCLWPTRTTDYSVRSSPWKEGRGDVVREASEACARAGLRFGLYLSPWDRHEPSYADPAAYDDFYCRQLEELLTGYGPLVEVWLDGAGPEGRKYDWPRIMALIRKHQPEAMVFNMGEPTIRWSGNEEGHAPDPPWNVVRREEVPLFSSGKGRSDGTGTVWLPIECDVPIRAGWFWKPGSEGTLKTLEQLLAIHHRSIGRGSNLLLNVAPDDRGLMPEPDRKRLEELRAELDRRLGRPLATTRGQADRIELDLGGLKNFDHVVIREDLREGERIRRYKLEAAVGNRSLEIARGRAVGHRRIHQVEPIEAEKLRLVVLEAAAPPSLAELSVFEGAAAMLETRREAKQAHAMEKPAGPIVEKLDRAIRATPAFWPLHALRSFILKESGRSEEALLDLDRTLLLEEYLAPMRHARAGLLLRLERLEQSVRDYDRAVAEGSPHSEDSCWERGLARYYLGDFEGARRQFEGYHRVGPQDIENGLWRFLCTARLEGLEQARATLYAYPQRRRKPFPALLDLYAGQGSVEAVLREAQESPEEKDEQRAAEAMKERLFYAHYYLGKLFEARGEAALARRHLGEALARPIHHFMLDCARIDARRLSEGAPKRS